MRREARTVRVMLDMYCRHNHTAGKTGGTKLDSGRLCADCQALWNYIEERLSRCPFRDDKPTCLACKVHCYRPSMREQVKAVMRFAGPRMALRHPVLSLFHFLDGRAAR